MSEIKYVLIISLCFSEAEFFAGFVSNTFGLFDNRGSENSSRFPLEFNIGKQTYENVGCPAGENVSWTSIHIIVYINYYILHFISFLH